MRTYRGESLAGGAAHNEIDCVGPNTVDLLDFPWWPFPDVAVNDRGSRMICPKSPCRNLQAIDAKDNGGAWPETLANSRGESSRPTEEVHHSHGHGVTTVSA